MVFFDDSNLYDVEKIFVNKIQTFILPLKENLGSKGFSSDAKKRSFWGNFRGVPNSHAISIIALPHCGPAYLQLEECDVMRHVRGRASCYPGGPPSTFVASAPCHPSTPEGVEYQLSFRAFTLDATAPPPSVQQCAYLCCCSGALLWRTGHLRQLRGQMSAHSRRHFHCPLIFHIRTPQQATITLSKLINNKF